MKFLIAILVMNQLGDTKAALASLKYTAPDADWLIIDNGSDENNNYKEWIERYIKPPKLLYHRNDENVGVVKGLQQAYELATDYDIIAFLHNDVYVYEFNWHKRIASYFADDNLNIGLASFFGAKGTHLNGARFDSTTNMLEAEIHAGGFRQAEPYVPISIVDGFSMICSRKMLDDIGGIDQDYVIHHGYDRDLPLKSLQAGYNNIAVNVPCHHISGITACRPDYQEWINKKLDRPDGDHYCHDNNTIGVFNEKWADKLPIYIEKDFSFRGGQFKKWR